MAATIKHFDILDFVKKSKELGVSEPVAEYQARQIEQAIDIAVLTAKEEIHVKDLATSRDMKELELRISSNIKELELKLEAKIAESKTQVIIWLGSMLGSMIVASGLLQHFFK